MDYKEIKKLMDDMGNSKLSEIEIDQVQFQWYKK